MVGNINSRITLDFDSVCSDIDSILSDIRHMRSERYFSRTLGIEAVQRLKEYETAIKKRLRDPFSLVVIGDFKRGKSTLINAILGDEILPASVTPETVTINRISYDETPKAEAILQNGKRISLDHSELKRDIMERILPDLPSPIEYVEIKSDNTILKDISIVDTPGVGDLMNAFDEQVADYLINADAIIYVVSARAPFSASEQAFLTSVVVPQSFSRVIVAVNMTDALEKTENINKVKAMTLERAESIGENVYVYMLSALDELCRKKGLRRPEPELESILENNFIEFENALQHDIILQKDIIKSMRGISLTDQMLRDTIARIELIRNALTLGVKKLNAHTAEFQNQDSILKRNIERRKTDMTACVDDMKSEAKHWISEFMARLKTEIETAQNAAAMPDIERHFQFYMIDSIKNAITTCVRYHQQDISVRISSTVKEMAQEITQQTFGSINKQIADCITNVSWTGTDSAMFSIQIADSVLGISEYLGPLYIIGQAVMGFARKKAVERRQSDFLTPVLEGYTDITTDVINSIIKIYDQMKYYAVDALDGMYQKQVEASEDAIRQAQDILTDETRKSDDVITYLMETASVLTAYCESLSKYK